MSTTITPAFTDYRRSIAPLTGAREIRVTFGAVFSVGFDVPNGAQKLELLKALRDVLDGEIREREGA